MRGQFIFSTARKAGLGLRAVIRNTLNSSLPENIEIHRRGMFVELEFFQDGRRLAQRAEYAQLKLNDHTIVDEAMVERLPGCLPENEVTCIATCRIGEAEDSGYFAQEHQLTYLSKNGFMSSVLYEQLPFTPRTFAPRPIVLIAPKCWIATSLNTYVYFCNSLLGAEKLGVGTQELDLFLFDTTGTALFQEQVSFPTNGTLVVKIRDLLPKNYAVKPIPDFFTLCAKGGSASYTIQTIIKNETLGSFSIEHSLSPHYYLGGDLLRARGEALIFGGIGPNG